MPTFGRQTMVKFVGGEMLVKFGGTDAIAMRTRLLEIRKRMLDLRPVWQQFKPIWLASTRDVFAAEGLPAPWPSLKPSYAAWKAQHYPGKSMMRRTDQLYRSLTVDGDRNMIWVGTQRTLQYGTRVSYWKYGQQKRPTLIMLRPTFDRLVKMVVEYVVPKHGV